VTDIALSSIAIAWRSDHQARPTRELSARRAAVASTRKRHESEAPHGCAKALAFLGERASPLGRPRRLLGTTSERHRQPSARDRNARDERASRADGHHTLAQDDAGRLDLLPYLEPDWRLEAAQAMLHIGLAGALRRLGR
jgi:hypothetical protein